jgi:hypothetical protein
LGSLSAFCPGRLREQLFGLVRLCPFLGRQIFFSIRLWLWIVSFSQNGLFWSCHYFWKLRHGVEVSDLAIIIVIVKLLGDRKALRQALLAVCRSPGVHCFVSTSGRLPFPRLLSVMPLSMAGMVLV